MLRSALAARIKDVLALIRFASFALRVVLYCAPQCVALSADMLIQYSRRLRR
jgi:hypothetical protein